MSQSRADSYARTINKLNKQYEANNEELENLVYQYKTNNKTNADDYTLFYDNQYMRFSKKNYSEEQHRELKRIHALVRRNDRLASRIKQLMNRSR